MDTRIQRALDGDLGSKDLTREEGAELRQCEDLFGRVLHSIPTQPMPDLSAAVLARLPAEREVVRESPLDIIRGAFAWFWQPRAVAFRPAYAFGAFALIATTLLLRPVASTSNAQVLVQFRLDAPNAQQVSLAGDFTSWKPEHQLIRSDNGTWTIVVPLEPGVHDYAFIIDGERWIADPAAPTIDDGFGGHNSRLAVLAPDTRTM